jgi:hypothetical protein
MNVTVFFETMVCFHQTTRDHISEHSIFILAQKFKGHIISINFLSVTQEKLEPLVKIIVTGVEIRALELSDTQEWC